MYCAIRTEVLCHHGGSIAPSQPGTGPSRHSYRSIRVEVQRHLGLGTAPSGSWYTKIKYLFINSIIFFSISFILHIVKYNYIYIYIQGVSPNSQHRLSPKLRNISKKLIEQKSLRMAQLREIDKKVDYKIKNK